jgi:hypothetical protein
MAIQKFEDIIAWQKGQVDAHNFYYSLKTSFLPTHSSSLIPHASSLTPHLSRLIT